MTPEQTANKVKELSVENVVLLKRYEARMAAYTSACLENDGKAADEQRAQMHDLLDGMLDNVSTLQMLIRQSLS